MTNSINQSSQAKGKRGGDALYPVAEEDGEVELDKEEFPDASPRGEGDMESEEATTVQAPPIPTLPSQQEVEQHRLTHRLFRLWCPHCVRGKSREDRHLGSRQKDEWHGIPKIASDYFFIGQRRSLKRSERESQEKAAEEEGQTPILVIKDCHSKALFAHACPCKGAHEAVVARVVSDLDMLGYKRVLVRTDGEPAILDLWNKVKEKWGGEIVKVESATGYHNSDGVA